MQTNNTDNVSRKYAANKGNYLLFIIIAFLLPVVYISILSFRFKELIPFSLISFVPFIFLLWIYCSTSYRIVNKEIFYRSAFLKGAINIEEVTEIELIKRPKEGVRPALASNGMMIHHGAEKKVFIAPADSKEFLKSVQKINSDIKVIRKLSVSQY